MPGSDQHNLDPGTYVLENSRVDPYRCIVKLPQAFCDSRADAHAAPTCVRAASRRAPQQAPQCPARDSTVSGVNARRTTSRRDVSLNSAAASMCQVSRRSREAIGPLAPCSRWIRRARKFKIPRQARRAESRLQTALAKPMMRATVPTFTTVVVYPAQWAAARAERGRAGVGGRPLPGRPCPQRR